MTWTTIHDHLGALYGAERGAAALASLQGRVSAFQRPAAGPGALSQKDALLITYGDMVRADGDPALKTLATFCDAQLRGVLSGIHVLPFYPYTSDDGFSVVDYRAVDPALGGWDDITRLGRGFALMFDAVVNHVSASSAYFQGFLRDDPRYRGFIMTAPEGADVSAVVRPRTHPLLTRFDTAAGPRNVWTTFSPDQIDLDFRNPDTLLEVLDVLLFYIARGAQFIRLDAIAFLWKELGTSCLHLPNTHRVIQLMRALVDLVAPGVVLITETNVPHRDNVSYFGDGANEAQMVYNFALPPLAVHTFRVENARALTQWARTLALPSRRVTFFNFLASHDGIGLNPARGILSDAEIAALVQGTLDRGGFINYKANPDGSRTPYEMNINFLDALAPVGTDDADRARRAIAAHAVMLALTGVPGLYFHSLFGSRGWPEGVRALGHNRAVNRQKLSLAELQRDLAQPDSLRQRVFSGLAGLIRARGAHPAFGPFGEQRVLGLSDAVFGVLRMPAHDSAHRDRVVCLVNVTADDQLIDVDWRALLGTRNSIRNLVSGTQFNVHGPSLLLRPHQVMWATA